MTLETSLNLFALVISGAMAALLAAVLLWFAAPISHGHYRHWAAAWVSQAAYYLLGALSFGLGVLAPMGAGPRFLLSSATQIANVLGAALLVIGALGYVRRQVFSRTQLLQVTLVCVLIGVTIAAISQLPDWRIIRQIMRGAFSAASLIAAGMIVRGGNQSETDRPRRLLALSLIGFGLVHVHYVAYAVASAMGMRPPNSLAHLTIFDVAWITAIVTTKITLAFSDQQEEATAALEARDAEFRQLLEHSSDMVLILDESLVLRYISPSTTRVLGWTPDTLGQSFEARVHPADFPTLTEWVSRYDPKASSPFLLRLRHRSGN